MSSNENMDLIRELKKRPNTRIEIVRSRSADIDTVLRRLHFIGKAEDLVSLNENEAVKTLTRLLNKDMAYSSELIQEDIAAALAKLLINSFIESNSTFYSNAEWYLYNKKEVFSFNPLTSATFDGGIIIQNELETICIWFEDED